MAPDVSADRAGLLTIDVQLRMGAYRLSSNSRFARDGTRRSRYPHLIVARDRPILGSGLRGLGSAMHPQVVDAVLRVLTDARLVAPAARSAVRKKLALAPSLGTALDRLQEEHVLTPTRRHDVIRFVSFAVHRHLDRSKLQVATSAHVLSERVAEDSLDRQRTLFASGRGAYVPALTILIPTLQASPEKDRPVRRGAGRGLQVGRTVVEPWYGAAAAGRPSASLRDYACAGPAGDRPSP